MTIVVTVRTITFYIYTILYLFMTLQLLLTSQDDMLHVYIVFLYVRTCDG